MVPCSGTDRIFADHSWFLDAVKYIVLQSWILSESKSTARVDSDLRMKLEELNLTFSPLHTELKHFTGPNSLSKAVTALFKNESLIYSADRTIYISHQLLVSDNW